MSVDGPPGPPPASALFACLEDSPTLIALFDPEERMVHANRSWRAAYALSVGEQPTWEQLMRRCHRERSGLLIETDDIEAWLADVRRSYRQVPVRTFESDLVDGRWLSVTETLHEGGWVLVVGCDVTPLKANEATLRSARDKAVLVSLTDPLTGLYNRRFIFNRLSDLLSSAHSMRFPLTVAVLDLDDFKAVNDRYGHAVGDEVLVQFAQQLQRHLRPLDSVGRVGGEEFLMLFPNASVAGAQAALERLQALAASTGPCPQHPALRCSFSAGVTAAEPGDTVERLYGRADRALYLAKAAGRGRSITIEGAACDTPGAADPTGPA